MFSHSNDMAHGPWLSTGGMQSIEERRREGRRDIFLGGSSGYYGNKQSAGFPDPELWYPFRANQLEAC